MSSRRHLWMRICHCIGRILGMASLCKVWEEAANSRHRVPEQHCFYWWWSSCKKPAGLQYFDSECECSIWSNEGSRNIYVWRCVQEEIASHEIFAPISAVGRMWADSFTDSSTHSLQQDLRLLDDLCISLHMYSMKIWRACTKGWHMWLWHKYVCCTT